jgi:2,4-dienoyl-CoA reductase-like NADH-dependent reductase (Old Yellow Enzyme family)
MYDAIPDMAEIFEATTLNGIQLQNRLVRSATWEGLADRDGRVTPALVRIHEELAEGGVGLIISSYLYVQKVGKQSQGQIGVYSDDLVPGLAELARAVHDRGGKIVGQIVHCGGQADRRQAGGLLPVAPSAVDSPGYSVTPHELTTDEIHGIVDDFAAAARRLQEASFDGVQLHGAHGYLLAQFLSPLRNLREDEYGGSLESRARLCLEVFRAIRTEVGPDFPVMIKLNANDFLDGSTTEEDSCFLAAALAAEGIAAIEVSGGTPGSGKLGAARPDIKEPEDEAYFLPQAEAIRNAAPSVPLMLVGGVRSPEVIDKILASGTADYFSMCRPLIREPGLPNRWKSGDLRRAACISCLGCFGPARKGEGIRCVQAPPSPPSNQ